MNREQRRQAEAMAAKAAASGAIIVIQRKNFDYETGFSAIVEMWKVMLAGFDKKEKYGVHIEKNAEDGILAALDYLYANFTRWPDFYINAKNPVTFSLDLKQWLTIDVPPDGVESLLGHRFNKKGY